MKMNKLNYYLAAITISLLSSYFLGKHNGIKKQLVEQEKLQQKWQKQINDSQQEYQQQLLQVNAEKLQWYESAQKQSIELANLNKQLDTAKEKLRKDISNAVKQDKKTSTNCHVLGNNSLQLYNQALGYTD